MAINKNKRISKGKKGGKKKAVDPFARKEWYDLKSPSMFKTRNFGKTLVSKSLGTKLASDSLMGRVFEVSLADLNEDEDQAFRKMKLSCEHIQGRNCLTDFHGMTFTRDKLASLTKKKHSLIEGNVDVKTTDGYTLRLFCIGYTKRSENQVKATCYANQPQVKKIRGKMVEVMKREVSTVPLREAVKKFIPESIGKEIEKQCRGIYPLENVFVRKVKIVKKPKTDLLKLMELHGDGGGGEDMGMRLKESEAAANPLTAEVQAEGAKEAEDDW
eukprot:Platyproteum_vivax@DN1811_c0_g1_i1.p1